jgi:hypothetical protein
MRFATTVTFVALATDIRRPVWAVVADSQVYAGIESM